MATEEEVMDVYYAAEEYAQLERKAKITEQAIYTASPTGRPKRVAEYRAIVTRLVEIGVKYPEVVVAYNAVHTRKD